MSDDTRERARQVAHGINGPCAVPGGGHFRHCEEITDALVNAARNERIRWADRVEALARHYARPVVETYFGTARATEALEALAAELRAEGGGT